jgi:hypothetical protein
MFGKNLNPALNAVVGGWNLSPIFSYHGGFPLTIAGNDFSGTNSFGSRANCSGPPSYVKQFQSGAGLQWFSDAPYSNPVINTFGDCGVSTVRGPGLNRWDLGVQKECACVAQAGATLFLLDLGGPNDPFPRDGDSVTDSPCWLIARFNRRPLWQGPPIGQCGEDYAVAAAAGWNGSS